MNQMDQIQVDTNHQTTNQHQDTANHQTSGASLPNNLLNQIEQKPPIKQAFSKIKRSFLITGIIIIIIAGLILLGFLLNHFLKNSTQVKELSRSSQPVPGTRQQITEVKFSHTQKSIFHQDKVTTATAQIVQSTSQLTLQASPVKECAFFEFVHNQTGAAIKFPTPNSAQLYVSFPLLLSHLNGLSPGQSKRLLPQIQLDRRQLQTEEKPQSKNLQTQILKIFATTIGLEINRITITNSNYYYGNFTKDGFVVEKQTPSSSRSLEQTNEEATLTEDQKRYNIIVKKALKNLQNFIKQCFAFIQEYGDEISNQLNVSFHNNLDIMTSSEKRQYYGSNKQNILITSTFSSVLPNSPKQINETKIIQKATHQIIESCYSYNGSKLCDSELFNGKNSLYSIVNDPEQIHLKNKKYQTWKYSQTKSNSNDQDSSQNDNENDEQNVNQNLQVAPSFTSLPVSDYTEANSNPQGQTDSSLPHQHSSVVPSSDDETDIYQTQTISHSHTTSASSSHDTETSTENSLNHQHSTTNSQLPHETNTVSQHTHETKNSNSNENKPSQDSTPNNEQKESNSNPLQHDHSKSNTDSTKNNQKSDETKDTSLNTHTHSQKQKYSQKTDTSQINSDESSKKQQTSSTPNAKQATESQKTTENHKQNQQNKQQQPNKNDESQKTDKQETKNSQIPAS